jgi:transcriptional regulator with XRE-family HTH domain
MDQLQTYLTARKRDRIETKGDFARRIGITQARLSRLLAGRSYPDIPLALEIERATDGAVPVSAWASK